MKSDLIPCAGCGGKMKQWEMSQEINK
jgi:hypothetical protein